MSWVGIRCHVVLCIIFEAKNIIMSSFALNHSHIGLELAETLDSTYIRCDAHQKNVCESLIKFVFGTKDTIKVRRDMEVCGVRPHLWLKRDPHNLGKIFKPIAPYVLTPEELKTFMSRLGSLKVPSYYCGALGKHIMDRKLGLMKSHHWHMLM